MPVNFTPQFFSRPTSAPAPSLSVNSPVSISEGSSGQQRKYTPSYNVPQRATPFASRPPTVYGGHDERIADIDWAHHETITADGRHVKFGAPRFSD